MEQDGNRVFGIGRMTGEHFQNASRYATTISWPKLKRIALQTVWKWLLQQKGFSDGFSNNATSRALNALSHLSDYQDGPLALFWAIVGIEALYGKGKESLMEQIREKTQIFLGEQTAFKKKISQMYNFRSGFVHGGLDFPSIYLHYDARPEVEKHGHELFESTNLAIAILIATIQELIIRDWAGLKFSYLISDTGID